MRVGFVWIAYLGGCGLTIIGKQSDDAPSPDAGVTPTGAPSGTGTSPPGTPIDGGADADSGLVSLPTPNCSDVCPGAGGTCADDGTCVWSSSSDAMAFTCPAGLVCQVRCTTSIACGHIDCSQAKACDIACATGSSCQTIDCGAPIGSATLTESCTVKCQTGGACQTVNANATSVDVSCTTGAGCQKVNCAGGACNVTCTTGGSCGEISCCASTCTNDAVRAACH